MSAMAMLKTGVSALGTQRCCCRQYNTTNGLTTLQPSYKTKSTVNLYDTVSPILLKFSFFRVLKYERDRLAVQESRSGEATEDKQRLVLLVHR